MNKDQRLIAVVGDLVGSKKHANRPLVEPALRETIGSLNHEYSTEVYAPLRLVRGIDEISGVLRKPDFSFEICARVNEKIFPARLRWGIGWGEIDVNLESHDAGAMDGTAFHYAAAAMDRARKHKLTYAFSFPNITTEEIAFIESSAALYSAIVKGWTEKSAMLSIAMRNNQRQADAAAELDISPQRVSQLMRRGSIEELRNFEDAISWSLANLISRQV